MIKVTGFSRWRKKPKGFVFWDARPFTRIVSAFKDYLNIRDYILLNQFEAQGLERWQARHNVLMYKLRTG